MVRSCFFQMIKGVWKNNQISSKTILERQNHFLGKRKHFPQISFFYACAIQINPGTNERLKQKCAREYRLLAKTNKN